MNAREAILLAKMNKKGNPQLKANLDGFSDIKSPTANVGGSNLGLEAKTGQIGPSIPSAKMGSLDVLKTIKASDMPASRPKPKYEAEVELGPTESQGYSPIKNYLKKKGK